MPERRRKYTPEFKDEATRMVVESDRPIAEVARVGLPVVNAEIPTIFPFAQVVALQLTFTHPTRTVSIKPSDLRKRCKSMVFR